MKQYFELEEPILSTGAFSQPLKIIDETGNGTWAWVLSEFIDDTFLDVDIKNPRKYGQTKTDILG